MMGHRVQTILCGRPPSCLKAQSHSLILDERMRTTEARELQQTSGLRNTFIENDTHSCANSKDPHWTSMSVALDFDTNRD